MLGEPPERREALEGDRVRVGVGVLVVVIEDEVLPEGLEGR